MKERGKICVREVCVCEGEGNGRAWSFIVQEQHTSFLGNPVRIL